MDWMLSFSGGFAKEDENGRGQDFAADEKELPIADGQQLDPSETG